MRNPASTPSAEPDSVFLNSSLARNQGNYFPAGGANAHPAPAGRGGCGYFYYPTRRGMMTHSKYFLIHSGRICLRNTFK